MNIPQKTQTIRISRQIHALAKSAAAKEETYLQIWIETLILKELQENKK